MKKSDKILLTLVSFVGMGFSAFLFLLFYSMPHPQFLLWANYIFAGLSIFVGLVFFVILCVAITSTNLSNFMLIGADKGEIQISQKTIESTALYSIIDLKQIASSDFKAKVSRTPEKTKIYVRLYVNDYSEISILTKEVQSRIDTALKQSLEIEVKSIIIRVIDISTNTKVTKNTAKNSRVS